MNALTEVRTIEVITAEIRALTASALANIIEIGRRLSEAKAMLPYGEFGPWLESVGYSHSTANNFMRLFDAYGSKQGSLFGAEVEDFQTYGKLSYSKALALLDVPAEERADFVETHNVDEMSTRELKAAIKERDEARAALQATEARLQDTQRTLADSDKQITDLRRRLVDAQNDIRAADEQAGENERRLQERIEELENRPVEVAVQEPDPEEIRMRVEAAMLESETQHRAELDRLQKKIEKAEKTAEKAEKEKSAAEERAKNAMAEAEKGAAAAADAAAKEAGAAKAEAEKLRAEVEGLTKQLRMSDEAVTTFKVHFEAWQRAYSAMRDALSRMSDETADKLRGAVTAQMKKWGEE